jgi:hypothetical protein
VKRTVSNTMKTSLSQFILATALVVGTALSAHAQSGGLFTLNWSTLDGGGGTSTGGVYSVSGTIGQPDAGTMSGGNYSLAGGFWGAIPTHPSVLIVIKLWVVDNEVHLRFNGIPGRTYEIERAHFVSGPWRPNNQPFAMITMPIDGVVEFVDTTAFFSPQSFYRTSTR